MNSQLQYYNGMLCEKCGRSISTVNFYKHICIDKFDPNIKIVQDLYSSGLSLREIIKKGFDKKLVGFVLRGRKRSLNIAMKLARIKFPESFVMSDETKDKIRQKRVAYLKSHINTTFQRRNNGEMSYGEQRLHDLFVKNDIYKQYDVVNEYCEYPYFLDFAFVNEKVDVEFDGHWHFTEKRQQYDKKRDGYLQQKGWRSFRIAYHELNNFDVNKLINFIGNPKEKHHTYDLIKYYEIKKIKRQEKKELLDQQRKLQRLNRNIEFENKQKYFIDLVLNSNIDFSKFGWVKQVAKLINKLPQKVNKWMKKNMLNFYNEKCFKTRIQLSNITNEIGV